MAEWVRKCLECIFPGVHGPKILYQTRKNRKQGPPLCVLFLIVSNPNLAALAPSSRLDAPAFFSPIPA